MEERITRNKAELVVRDTGTGLEIAFYRLKGGNLKPGLSASVTLKGNDISFFAGQMTDPSVLDPAGKVDLKEPYPYIVRVRWDGMHRILSFVPWEGGEAVESIRLSPLEAYRVGILAQNTTLINHLIDRLARWKDGVNDTGEDNRGSR